MLFQDKLVAELPFPNEIQEFSLPVDIHPGAIHEEPAVQLRTLMKDFTNSAASIATSLPNLGSPGNKRGSNSGRTTPTLKTVRKLRVYWTYFFLYSKKPWRCFL
jgi:hypothetical protein